MKISIFGLGYVGSVAAACLSKQGHTVLGVDPNQNKVDIINAGQAPLIEPGLTELIESSVQNGSLKATTDAQEAVAQTDLSFVCVGTPSQANGNLELTYVRKVCEEIGLAIKAKDDYHVLVLRSTALPGTTRNTVIPILEESSGKVAGKDFGVCFNPEFLREGTAVADYHNPPKTVIGEIDTRAGDLVTSLYKDIDAPLIRTSLEVSELVKYADNAWHALKVGYANEIGNISKAVGVDSHQVMEIFCQDLKLNISPNYLKPGYAFGGSCLPKDLRALSYTAKTLDLNLPILTSILPSNAVQVDRAFRIVESFGLRKIGVLGFSFKADTDDLRESPTVELIEKLLGKGYDIKLFDENVNLARLTGSNKSYIENQIPHISRLMEDNLDNVFDHADLIIIGTKTSQFKEALEKHGDSTRVLDLVRISEPVPDWDNYEGICW